MRGSLALDGGVPCRSFQVSASLGVEIAKGSGLAAVVTLCRAKAGGAEWLVFNLEEKALAGEKGGRDIIVEDCHRAINQEHRARL